MEDLFCNKPKNQKRVFIFFPFWNMEKVEKALSEQEQNGYRFVKLKFGCLFTFQKSTPRKAQYVLIYTFPKESWLLWKWEDALKSDAYRANVMHQGHNYGIFRITKNDVDLNDFYVYRLWYVKRVLIQKTVIAILMTLPSVYAALASNLHVIARFFSIFISVGGVLELLLYIIGFCVTAQKKKKIVHKHE